MKSMIVPVQENDVNHVIILLGMVGSVNLCSIKENDPKYIKIKNQDTRTSWCTFGLIDQCFVYKFLVTITLFHVIHLLISCLKEICQSP